MRQATLKRTSESWSMPPLYVFSVFMVAAKNNIAALQAVNGQYMHCALAVMEVNRTSTVAAHL